MEISSQLDAILIGLEHARKWYELLSKEKATIIHCYQLISAAHGSCDDDILKSFLKLLNEHLAEINSFDKIEPNKIFSDVRKNNSLCLVGKIIKGDRENDECCFTHKASDSTSEIVEDVCCVVRLWDFWNYYRPKDGNFDHTDVKLFAKLAENGKVTPEGLIQTNTGFQWVTKYSSLSKVIEEAQQDDIWSRIREVMAIDVKDRLVLFIYPDDFRPMLCCKPTYVEGGSQSHFFPFFGDNLWNNTIDLGSMSVGVPEALHCPFEIGDNKFKYKLIEPNNDQTLNSDICHQSEDRFLLFIESIIDSHLGSVL